MPTVPDHEVLIVGAGFSGIGVAISLQKAGMHDYAIVESGDRFGGTWQWNTYPGVAVDIPSFSYQFSFERRSDWSRVYAPGAELRAYAEHCATKYGLHDKARFQVRIDGATFDADARAWRVTTNAGEELTARHVVDATGVLTHPKRPEIPGVDDFEGVTLHTARWDHEQELAGKRVAVIGTGASAVQVIPAIADEVEHLTVFQRRGARRVGGDGQIARVEPARQARPARPRAGGHLRLRVSRHRTGSRLSQSSRRARLGATRGGSSGCLG